MQPGSITVEMSLLFPTLFLLWILILWILFGIYARCLSEIAVDRMVILLQTDPIYGQSKGIEEVRKMAAKSGIGLGIDSFQIDQDENLFYTGYHAQVQISHDLWGKRSIQAERRIYAVQGTQIRNTLDLIWEIGEELPVTGNVIREYQKKIARLRDEIAS